MDNYYKHLGMAIALMEQSPYHSTWPLYDVEIELVPPLLKDQFRFYFDEHDNPVAFVTWSAISEAVKDKLVNQQGQMAWEDWDSGDMLLFNDFVAPYGHTRLILKDLRSLEWSHDMAFSLRRNMDGSIAKVNYWWHSKDKHNSKLQQHKSSLRIAKTAYS